MFSCNKMKKKNLSRVHITKIDLNAKYIKLFMEFYLFSLHLNFSRNKQTFIKSKLFIRKDYTEERNIKPLNVDLWEKH